MASILVLDDVMDAAILVQRILEKKGHVVHVFSDEDQSLVFVRENRVDLAIVDMKLRKMEGIEVMAEIKKLRPEIQVILMTGFPTRESAAKAMKLGAFAYCIKPVDKEDLEKTVARALADTR